MENTPTPGIPALAPLLSELDAAERGFILARLLSAGAGEDMDTLVNTGLAGASAARCAALGEAVRTLPRPERLRLVNLLAREALAPTPPGLENVHAETLRELLRAESDWVVMLVAAHGPPALRQTATAILAAGPSVGSGRRFAREQQDDGALARSILTASPEAVTQVLRAVLAPVVSVPALTPGASQPPRRLALRLAQASPAALLEEVAMAGAALLGTSLRGADADIVKRAMAHVGPPWGEQVRWAAASPAREGPSTEGDTDPDEADDGDAAHAAAVTQASPADPVELAERALARHLVATTGPADTARHTLERLGARALGARLRDEDSDLVLAVAQRLPRELGQLLREAAHGNGNDPLGRR
ncbi:MAG: hypothetical protein ABJA82_06975 [Myxococcales bacterium]